MNNIKNNKVIAFDFDGTICEAHFSKKYGEIISKNGITEEGLVVEQINTNIYDNLKPVSKIKEFITETLKTNKNMYIISIIHSSKEADHKKGWLAKEIPEFNLDNFIGVFNLSQKIAVLKSFEKITGYYNNVHCLEMVYVDDSLSDLIEIQKADVHGLNLLHVSSLLTD